MKITRKRITAAEGDDQFNESFDNIAEDPDAGFEDKLDDMADSIEDMQDTVEDVVEDDVSIENDNNIENHYIAECEKCKGIFISATIESDQVVTKISGTCPICEKESDQYLKWIVRKAE